MPVIPELLNYFKFEASIRLYSESEASQNYILSQKTKFVVYFVSVKKILKCSWEWWHMPVIPGFGRLRQKDCSEFEATQAI